MQIKNKKEIDELLLRPITVFIDHKDRFEQKEMKKKKKRIKSTWYYWLIEYISEPLRKTVGGFRDNVVSLFMTNTRETYNTQTAGCERN